MNFKWWQGETVRLCGSPSDRGKVKAIVCNFQQRYFRVPSPLRGFVPKWNERLGVRVKGVFDSENTIGYRCGVPAMFNRVTQTSSMQRKT